MSQIVMIKCQQHHMLPHLFPIFRIPLNEIHCGTFDQHCQLITFVCRSLTKDTQFEGGEPTCIVQALTTFVQMIFSITSIFGCGHPYFPPWRMAAYLAITIIPGSLLGVFFFLRLSAASEVPRLFLWETLPQPWCLKPSGRLRHHLLVYQYWLYLATAFQRKGDSS